MSQDIDRILTEIKRLDDDFMESVSHEALLDLISGLAKEVKRLSDLVEQIRNDRRRG